MSDAAIRIEFKYFCIIMNIFRNMTESCRTCTLAPCGHKRKKKDCLERLGKHYRVPAFEVGQPKGGTEE